MENDAKLKTVLDRIDDLHEKQAAFVLKAILLTDRISTETMDKAIDLSGCVARD